MKPERRVIDGIEYVLLRPRSYEHLREELRIARALLASEKEYNERTRDWARDGWVEAQRLGDRCTFLYGVATKRGASTEELRG